MSKFFGQQGMFSQQNQQQQQQKQQNQQQQQQHSVKTQNVITKIVSPASSTSSMGGGGYSNNSNKIIKLEPGTSHHNHQKINSHLLDHGYGVQPHYANIREVNRVPPKPSDLCITNYYKVSFFFLII